MALTPGSRIGPYDVVSTLGAGGMGEVFRARDTRLQRDVALKILPDAFATDPERLARFQREAQVLASLKRRCQPRRPAPGAITWCCSSTSSTSCDVSRRRGVRSS